MITLCGFALSNYYNKVKLALIEKSLPFEEKLVWTGRSPELLMHSPLGKIPYIETPEGSLCESQVILDYIENLYPEHPLLPANPFAVAKLRELITFIELHLELPARELYTEAFFGGKVTDEVKAKVEKKLTHTIPAFASLAKFDPFVGGKEFTMADCVAVVHFPLISMATKIIYGRDFLADLPTRDYVKMMSERPSVQKVNADRKANQELMASKGK
ncbi:glutathione S-transferase [Undibacterium sp. Di26W]|uniref:glutathione S-transferase family protein n=1 Tax=Undibacterium sp. Di26W TaxID=3413035 RepID=UPI003BEF5F7C